MIARVEYRQGSISEDTPLKRIVTRLADFHENETNDRKFHAAINGATLK